VERKNKGKKIFKSKTEGLMTYNIDIANYTTYQM
jgi:hypothetical protein